MLVCFFFQAEDGIRDYKVTGVQTCALPIFRSWKELMNRPVSKLRVMNNVRFGIRCEDHLAVWSFVFEVIGSWSGCRALVFPKIGRASCRERGEVAEGVE